MADVYQVPQLWHHARVDHADAKAQHSHWNDEMTRSGGKRDLNRGESVTSGTDTGHDGADD